MTDYNKTIKEQVNDLFNRVNKPRLDYHGANELKFPNKPTQNKDDDNTANDHRRFIDDNVNAIINADDEQAARHVLMDIITNTNHGLYKYSLKDGI